MTTRLNPEVEAEIRQYVEANRRSVKDFRASLSAAERNQAVLLDEVDRLRALDRNAIKNEAENEKFLVAACAVIDNVLDTDGNDGLLADIQRLADEVKKLRAFREVIEELANQARRPFGIARSEAFDAICRLVDGGAQ